MNLIVMLFFTSIVFKGNSQLVRHPRFLSKLQGELISNVEPDEIKSIKGTMVSEKQTNLKPQILVNAQNIERSPEISVQNSYPRQRLKYKNNKGHMLNQPTIHIDTENSIIDYERNDTTATQRKLVKIESMIIKHSKDDSDLFDFTQSNEDHNDKSIDENIYDTKQLTSDTHNLPTTRNDFEMTQVYNDSFENILVNDRRFLIPDEVNNNKYKSENIETLSSSTLNSLHDKTDNGCADNDENEISERADGEIFNKNERKDMVINDRGITDLVMSRMMLFNHPRVCYACNSILDESCWSPNRTTTVKYCRRDHYACLTKVFQPRGKPQVIRDCGESCSSFSEVASGEAYASCTICESDLCNSASVIEIKNIVFILVVAINIKVDTLNSLNSLINFV